jgi:hypothetical protein
MLYRGKRAVLGAITFAVAAVVGMTYFTSNAGAQAPFPVLYVSNFNSDEITAYDARKGTLLGVIVRSRGEIRGANGIAVGPDGDIYLSGQFSNNVVRYDGKSGRFKAKVDPENRAGVSSPQGLNFGPDGLLYAASYDNDKVVTYNTANNTFVRQFADVKTAGVRHMGPEGPFFGPDGHMYLGHFDGNTTLKFQGPERPNQPAVAGAPRPGTVLATFEKTAAALAGQQGGAYASGVAFGATVSNPNPTSIAAPASGETFVYIDHIDPKTFTGEVLQYTTEGKLVKEFIPFRTAGLVLTGGIDVGPDGNLYVANVKVNEHFQDQGSTIMRFNIKTGSFMGTFVAQGKRLAVPFAMCFAKRQAPVPHQ